jgi:16S rRNA G966 N2-methylase RsmD
VTETALANLRIPGGRGSTFYLAHSYHTKVPPEAIIPFLEHYTEPGAVVLDPFCGSGMIGVAAAVSGRRAILNDLSPAAIHLAWNHTRPCDPEALAAGFAAIEERLGQQFRDLYSTKHSTGELGYIYWTLWSTHHRCPACSKKFSLWDSVDRVSGRVGPLIDCPRCGTELRRRNLKTIGSAPAWISYETADGRRFRKPASPADISRALRFHRDEISEWFPTHPVGPDREMYVRCALQLQHVSSTADFYTARNLKALALLWREIGRFSDERVKRALAFAFTNTAWHGTRMRRFNARGGQRPLTGTLYIPQLSSETNVLEVMRNKIRQLQRYFRNYRPATNELPFIMMGSAAHLESISDGSIDYIFTDPPFGSNIFYADCNLIWESWLEELTNTQEEAVINRSLAPANGGKSLDAYAKLMTEAMHEMARVLKPGAWATVVFHNTDAAVWQAIQEAATTAEFEFHEAASLDRRQQSHKGYKGRSGSEDVAHFDVVLNLRKPVTARRRSKSSSSPSHVDLTELITAIACDTAVVARGLQGIHAEVMRRLASKGTSAFVSYADVRDAWRYSIKNRRRR